MPRLVVAEVGFRCRAARQVLRAARIDRHAAFVIIFARLSTLRCKPLQKFDMRIEATPRWKREVVTRHV